MKLASVIVSFNRLELLKETVFSYLETVSVPFSLVIVDNRSDQRTRRWLRNSGLNVIFLSENRYPGYATNRGWEEAVSEGTEFLHRSDSDFRYLPGWWEQVEKSFRDSRVGQVGLRTPKEDNYEESNVGGNCVIRRELWNAGLRYDETPWPELRERYGDGMSEDSFFSPAVEKMGYRWTRVKASCVQNLASGDWSDSYYSQSYGIRGIRPSRQDPTVPADWKWD